MCGDPLIHRLNATISIETGNLFSTFFSNELGGLEFDLLSYFYCNSSRSKKPTACWQQAHLMLIWNWYESHIWFFFSSFFPAPLLDKRSYLVKRFCWTNFLRVSTSFFPPLSPLHLFFPVERHALIHLWLHLAAHHRLLQLLSHFLMSHPLSLSLHSQCLAFLLFVTKTFGLL